MLIGLLVRSGLVVGAIYSSRKVGVWGSPEESEQLYINVKDQLRPHFRQLEERLPFMIPALPQTGEIGYLTKYYYNMCVKKTFNFIEMLPCYTSQVIKKIKDSVEEFSQPPK